MAKKGIFISFEGTDGTGKSTQARLLSEWLSKKGKRVVLTREPGGGPLAEKIRSLLLDPKLRMDGLTELFLYEAARCDHVERVVRPALAAGKWVICDRYADATLAYQGVARGLSLKNIRKLNDIATGGIFPKLTLWLDLPAAHGFARAGARSTGHDRIEKEGLRFQEKVRRGYAMIARKEPRRFRRVAVQKTIEATQTRVRAHIEPFL
jgi:dTMP kinase